MFDDVLKQLGMTEDVSGVYCGEWLADTAGPVLESLNPADDSLLGRVRTAARDDYEQTIARAQATFLNWRMLPPPRRGEFVRLIGEELRRARDDLGMLVTLEAGKIVSEGRGEVQEMIDMCDFAVGLSRQLYGLTIASERPRHRMFEQWHPLGPVGVITSFNFPVAVWAWNAMLAAVCGDVVVWKPSPITPLTAVAVQNIVNRVTHGTEAEGVFSLCISAGAEVGQWLADDGRVPLVSATGSTAMGRSVAEAVGRRLGRTILELSGNNGVIVTETADLELALRGVVFAAAGTAGQRCTTLRRLFVHRSVADRFIDRLVAAYGSIRVGSPWEEGVLMGPLIHEQAVEMMLAAVDEARRQGGEVLFGGNRIERPGHFVEPTIIRATFDMPVVQRETFAPILYVIPWDSFDEVLAWHNSTAHGLSSAIFTDRLTEAETFLSPLGSDCGIANVNIGTSGAEIGGAFGGEKDTGGGREAGSDSWKAYMRRQTCTVNWGSDLPLAQGVEFPI